MTRDFDHSRISKVLVKDTRLAGFSFPKDDIESVYISGACDLIKDGAALCYLGVVGTRSHSKLYRDALERILHHIRSERTVIVTGGAAGVDETAMRFAHHSSMPLVVILPCGFSSHSFSNWYSRYKDICCKVRTLLVSQFDLSQETNRHTPVRRNTLIAALSQTVILGEAGRKSGALYVADLAFRLGLPVFFQQEQRSHDTELTCMYHNLKLKGALQVSGYQESELDRLNQGIIEGRRRSVSSSLAKQLDFFGG